MVVLLPREMLEQLALAQLMQAQLVRERLVLELARVLVLAV